MKFIYIFILTLLPLVGFSQLGVFVGFGDSQMDKSIITYSAGVEYAFTSEEGFAIAPRVTLSERGGTIDNENGEIRERMINISYIVRKSFKTIEGKHRLFLMGGAGMDVLDNQTRINSQIVFPVGLGLKFGKVFTWFEYQITTKDDYKYGGFNLGYSF